MRPGLTLVTALRGVGEHTVTGHFSLALGVRSHVPSMPTHPNGYRSHSNTGVPFSCWALALVDQLSLNASTIKRATAGAGTWPLSMRR